VIVPDGDWQAMTDDELQAAYLAMGFSEATAKALARLLRHGSPGPDFPVD
jgi:hypothetical protein